jgi:hypothetical protein
MTTLQKIITAAKKLKKQYPNKYSKWTDYVKAASKTVKTGTKKVGAVKKKKAAKKKPTVRSSHTDKGSHNVKIKVVSGLNKVTRKGKKTAVHYSRISGVNNDGYFANMSELKAANKASGYFWFSPATMKFFNSKIESQLIAGKYFISSEKYKTTSPRDYSIREVMGKDGDIRILKGDFKSKQEAKEYLAKYRKK